MNTHDLRLETCLTLDNLLDPLEMYVAYTLGSDERVGRYSGPLPDAYRYMLLSAVKRHPETGAVEDGSYRKIPEEHPDVDAHITQAHAPEDCQYHIHVFGEELYSHYELRPDRPGQLHAHYRPTYGETYLEGIACPEIEVRIE